MDSNMQACTIAIREEYACFIYKQYKNIKNDMIKKGSLINFSNTSYDPFDDPFEECGEISFKEMNYNQIHTNF